MGKNTNSLITANDVADIFSGFTNERDRIKYMSKNYSKMGIAKAFGVYYNTDISVDVKTDRNINTVTTVEVGGNYIGYVKEFASNGTISFSIPGVKEEMLSKENFNSCRDAIENYLLSHDNKLMFEVREKKNGHFVVSVINAYYKYWQSLIDKAVQNEEGIQVHIDELVKGGYVCHTSIWPLKELTGKDYTSSVFIPGSHIVLNIEKDFEKWVGQDVIIVPQKFVEFRKDLVTGMTENSLVGSRKRVLQILGVKNMYQIYTDLETKKKLAEVADNVTIDNPVFNGTVTGIINSNKKIGVFVELDNQYITGLMPIDSTRLLDYHPGDAVNVRIKEFEIQEGKEPFIFNKKKQVIRANVRPVFEVA